MRQQAEEILTAQQRKPQPAAPNPAASGCRLSLAHRAALGAHVIFGERVWLIAGRGASMLDCHRENGAPSGH